MSPVLQRTVGAARQHPTEIVAMERSEEESASRKNLESDEMNNLHVECGST